MQKNQTPLSTKQIISLIIVVLVACIGFIATDIYTPSLPAIAYYFNIEIHLSQLSVSVFLFGSAMCQLIYGPISEAYGRKTPFLFGLFIMGVGSIICAMAVNIEMLILGRLVQGIGAGAGSLFRTILRDSLEGEQLSAVGAYFGIICVLVVPAAPMLGGYLEELFNWRASFIFMIIYILTTIIIGIFCLKETHQFPNKDYIKRQAIINTFCELLTSKIFMGYTICLLVTFGALFAWITASSVLLVHLVGVSPSFFGITAFLISALPMAFTTMLNSKLVKLYGICFMLKLGWGLMLISGLMILAGYFLFGISLYAIILPMMLFFISSTLIWPNVFAAAFTPFGHIAGYAGALYGFMQMIGGAIFSALISYLPEYNQVPLACVIILCPTICYIILTYMILPSESSQHMRETAQELVEHKYDDTNEPY